VVYPQAGDRNQRLLCFAQTCSLMDYSYNSGWHFFTKLFHIHSKHTHFWQVFNLYIISSILKLDASVEKWVWKQS
jgi:hypothetical protein